MRLSIVTFLIAMVCVVGTAAAAPDEAPAAEKVVARNVSVQLMDYGEGAERMLKLTLSHKWSDLPDSTRKHVLEKLRAALPEESLKKALLALARGETEVAVSAAPGQPAATSVPMVRLTPAAPARRVETSSGDIVRLGVPGEKLIVRGTPGEQVIVLGGEGGQPGQAGEPGQPGGGRVMVRGAPEGDVKFGFVDVEALEGMSEEARARFLEVLKKHGDGGAIRMRLGHPGGAVRVFEFEEDEDGDADDDDGCPGCAGDVKTEVEVVVAGDGHWQQLPPEQRKQVLESLRRFLPPEEMAGVLRALTRGKMVRGGSFGLSAMPGRPGCGCGKNAAQKKPGCDCGAGQAAPRKPGCDCGPGQAAPRKPGCGCGGGQAAPRKPGCGCGGGQAAPRKPGCGGGGGQAIPPRVWFARPDGPGPRGPGRHGRRGGDVQQDALVRALVALTHEVQALRREVAAMRGAHQGPPPVTAPQPPRRVMLRSMGVGGGAGGAAPKMVIEQAKCAKCQGECRCAPKPPPPPPHAIRVVPGPDGQVGLGVRVTPSAGGGGMMFTPDAPQRHEVVEQDMAKLRAEMAEIRAALQRLMMDLKKLQAGK